MVEAAEAIIGDILCVWGLQMDAMLEIEGTLGIRIIHSGGGVDGPDYGRNSPSFLVVYGGSGGGTSSWATSANN